MKLKIDKEFQNLIQPLTTEEFAGLKVSIEAEGIRDALVVWGSENILIDGHHRYQIAQELKCEFKTHEIEFEDRNDAKIWVVKNQFSRRNISAYQRGELALELEEVWKAKGKENLKTAQPGKRGGTPSQNSVKAIDTQKELAKIAGVSHDTIAKVKLIKETGSEEVKDNLRKGKSNTSIHKEYQVIKKKEKEEEKEKERKKKSNKFKSIKTPDQFTLKTGDFRESTESIKDNSVDLIFTDPPYDKESIPLYGDVAEVASRILKPGGSLLAYAGHYALPQILADMEDHLRYWWMLCLKHSGNEARLPGKFVFVGYKPIVWFVKEKRSNKTFIADHYISKPPDKKDHDWQQGTSEAKYYIDKLTEPGDLVVDPFLGSGTTLVAAKELNRKGWGCDIDEMNVNIAKERIIKCKTK